MAKKIEPINIWVNGQTQVGEFLQVTCINDNYENSANNYWQIFNMNNEVISSGNIQIFAEDYVNWGEQPAMAVNDWIYNWVASKLNIVII